MRARSAEACPARSRPTRPRFGLGPNTQVDDLTLRWPNGLVEQCTDLPADQVFRPVEGATVPFEGMGVMLRGVRVR